jgi:hypothetical protein
MEGEIWACVHASSGLSERTPLRDEKHIIVHCTLR